MPDKQRFSYVTVTNARGEVALRPLIPLSLSYHGQTLTAIGLADTGADVNVLPYSLGRALGAVWEERQTPLDLSGNLAQYEARGIILTAKIGDLPPIDLAFAWTQAENVPVILGQVNFFAEFDVCFYRSQNTFEVNVKHQPS